MKEQCIPKKLMQLLLSNPDYYNFARRIIILDNRINPEEKQQLLKLLNSKQLIITHMEKYLCKA